MNTEHLVNLERQLSKLENVALFNHSVSSGQTVDFINQMRSIISQIEYEEVSCVSERGMDSNI